MILITGATGKCGSAALKVPLKKGIGLRVPAREEARPADIIKTGAVDGPVIPGLLGVRVSGVGRPAGLLINLP